MNLNPKRGKFRIFFISDSWWLESPEGNQYEFGSFDTALMAFRGFDEARFVPKKDSISPVRRKSLKRHGC